MVWTVGSFTAACRLISYQVPHSRTSPRTHTWTPICISFSDFLILVRFMVWDPQKALEMGVQVVLGLSFFIRGPKVWTLVLYMPSSGVDMCLVIQGYPTCAHAPNSAVNQTSYAESSFSPCTRISSFLASKTIWETPKSWNVELGRFVLVLFLL